MDTSNLPKSFASTPMINFGKELNTDTLKGKSVIATGGANGIGAGCVRAFAKAGAFVAILDLNEEKGSELVGDLKREGCNAMFFKTDVSSWDAQVTSFKAAISSSPTKSLNLVLACAGLSGNSTRKWVLSVADSDDPEPPPTSTLDVNLTGVFYTTHLALHYFKRTAQATSHDGSSKHLLFIDSLAGYLGLNSITDYLATKFGVRGILYAVRNETDILKSEAGDGPVFRANSICPTFIRSDMTNVPGFEERLNALGITMGSIDDVVAGVMRVACDESITGRAIAIAPGEKKPGDKNFDLCDDWEGLNSGRELLGKISDGTIGGLQNVGKNFGLRG